MVADPSAETSMAADTTYLLTIQYRFIGAAIIASFLFFKTFLGTQLFSIFASLTQNGTHRLSLRLYLVNFGEKVSTNSSTANFEDVMFVELPCKPIAHFPLNGIIISTFLCMMSRRYYARNPNFRFHLPYHFPNISPFLYDSALVVHIRIDSNHDCLSGLWKILKLHRR